MLSYFLFYFDVAPFNLQHFSERHNSTVYLYLDIFIEKCHIKLLNSQKQVSVFSVFAVQFGNLQRKAIITIQ